MTSTVPPDLRARAQRLLTDFPYYAENVLRIRPKAGGLVPLVLNRAQRIVHDRLEAQLAETGRVRVLVLKGRQVGISTLIEARYFWKVTQRAGVQGYILCHSQQGTTNLFSMSQRFHANLPTPLGLLSERSNATELRFFGLDSGIAVSTAGSKGAGRSATLQYFHGSEVAHWQDASDHMAGVMQAVPDAPGTEVILESTAAGIGGLFYDMCKAAERGDGEYILVFIPWFWADEYRADPPEGWAPPPAFAAYGEAFGLSPAQTYWAHRKNGELAQACNASPAEPCWLFRQEYPATAAEAFQAAGHEAYIPPEIVLAARKFAAPDQSTAPTVLGVDIARGGRDKTRIVDRQGRRAGGRCDVTLNTRDLMQVVGRVGREVDRLKPDAVFIDGTGIGAGVYDRLRELGYHGLHIVNFGAKALDGDRYANKRAEMWGRMAEWLRDEGGADIPDDDGWQASICTPGYAFDSNSRLQLEAKEKIRARLGFSPDAGDALALTFAQTVHRINYRKLDPLAGLRFDSCDGLGWMRA